MGTTPAQHPFSPLLLAQDGQTIGTMSQMRGVDAAAGTGIITMTTLSSIPEMKQYGPIVSFVLEGKTQAECFLKACNLIFQATSFGGMHTTAERRARWGGDAIPDGFIRLSVGCEDTQDLLDDPGRCPSSATPAMLPNHSPTTSGGTRRAIVTSLRSGLDRHRGTVEIIRTEVMIGI